MPSEFTPRYNLAKPNVNGLETENVWGFDINLNFDKLDAAIIKPAELSEAIEDQTASLLRPGANISLAYNDSAGTLTITGLIGTEQIDDRVATLLRPGPYIGLAYNDPNGTLTISNLYGPIETKQQIFDTVKAGNNVAIAYDEPNNRITIHSLGPGGSTGPQNVFDTVHDARLAEIIPQLKVITLSGYNRPGDAGPAMPCRRTQGPVTDHAGWFRTADRYKADGFEDDTDGGYWEYVGDNQPIWIEWFGGAADYFVPDPSNFKGEWSVNSTPTDNYLPIKHAYEFMYSYIKHYLPAEPNPSFFASGPVVQLGYGAYWCSQTIKPERTFGLRGMGGHGNTSLTKLIFPQTVPGIWIVPNGSLPGSSSSHIRDIDISTPSKNINLTAHGIIMDGTCEISNCCIQNFGGDGIRIYADVSAGSNSNCFYLSRIFFETIGGHGVHCHGGDANAGVGIQLNLNNCGHANDGYGIYDDAFLGNTWVGCHAAGCGRTGGAAGGPYWGTGVNGPVVFIGCYSESGQGPSYAGPLVKFDGGMLASGMTTAYGGVQFSGARVFGGLSIGAPSAAVGDHIFFNMRHQANVVFGFGFNQPDGNPSGDHTFKHVGAGIWGLDFFSQISVAYGITDESNSYTTGRPGPVTCKPNRFALPTGVFLGGNVPGLGGRMFDLGETHPNDVPGGGTYAQGERRWYTYPAVGNDEGWVCTQSGGAGGTWTSGVRYEGGPVYVKNGINWYSMPPYVSQIASVPPVHTSGTVTGADGIPWTYATNTDAVWKGFGTVESTARFEAIEADRDALRDTIATLTSRLEALEAR